MKKLSFASIVFLVSCSLNPNGILDRQNYPLNFYCVDISSEIDTTTDIVLPFQKALGLTLKSNWQLDPGEEANAATQTFQLEFHPIDGSENPLLKENSKYRMFWTYSWVGTSNKRLPILDQSIITFDVDFLKLNGEAADIPSLHRFYVHDQSHPGGPMFSYPESSSNTYPKPIPHSINWHTNLTVYQQKEAPYRTYTYSTRTSLIWDLGLDDIADACEDLKSTVARITISYRFTNGDRSGRDIRDGPWPLYTVYEDRFQQYSSFETFLLTDSKGNIGNVIHRWIEN